MFSKAVNMAQNSVNVMNSVATGLNRFNTIADSNSARSAEEARIQREWQEAQNAKAMQFNAAEAEKSRNWQEYMSNTAHQREIADLKAAGLNPVLSAMGGNGAAVTSGAQASGVTSAGAKGEVDTSANQAIVNLLGSMLGFMGNLASSSVSAQASMANAQTAAETAELVGLLNLAGTQYSADRHLEGTRYSSDQQRAASAFASLLGLEGVLRTNEANAKLQEDKQAFEEYMRKMYPENVTQGISSGFGLLRDVFWNDDTKRIYEGWSNKTRDRMIKGRYNHNG